MPAAIILSGAGRYADPWHDFAETSQCLKELAHKSGWDPVIVEDVDQTLATGLDGIDLLIINTGDPLRKADEDDHDEDVDPDLIEQARAGLARAFDRGICVLGVHTAISSLRDYPQCREALGGEWTPDRSWHPPVSDLHVRPLHNLIVEGLCDFTIADERYTHLVSDPGTEALARVRCDDHDHTLAWACQYKQSRIIYDALGHDRRSYESRGHRSFLCRALSWLLPRQVFPD